MQRLFKIYIQSDNRKPSDDGSYSHSYEAHCDMITYFCSCLKAGLGILIQQRSRRKRYLNSIRYYCQVKEPDQYGSDNDIAAVPNYDSGPRTPIAAIRRQQTIHYGCHGKWEIVTQLVLVPFGRTFSYQKATL